jgi:protein SCO1
MSVRPKVLAVIAIVAAAGGMLLARAALQGPAPPPALAKATLLTPPKPLPELMLTDQDSRTFARSRLEQRWSLLFFGFTRCPAICPATLTVLAQAERELKDLPPEQRPQIVLVSVDPAHDSAERLKSYISSFNPDFLGGTGSSDAIQQFARSLGVAVTRQPLADGDYTVDHSTAIFLVDPRGALRAVFSTPHSPNVIADDYRRILARN